MLKNIEMKWMLIMAMLVAGLVPLIGTGLYALIGAENALHSKGFDQLNSLKAVKKVEVENYFQQIENQIITLSEDHMTIDLMRESKDGFHNLSNDLKVGSADISKYKSSVRNFFSDEFGAKFTKDTGESISAGRLMAASENGVIAQYLYISNNKHPLGSKSNLSDPEDGSSYTKTHGEHHPAFANYLEKFGYYDIFLVDHQSGDVVYSVFKEIDYATNLYTGAHKDSGLARVVKQAANARSKDETFVDDFAWYLPSYNAAASLSPLPFLMVMSS